MSDELVTLPHSHTPRLDAWRLRLTKRFGDRVSVTLTRNRRSMISIRRLPGGRVLLRMHIGFEEAPASILADIEEVIARNRVPPWRRICAHARAMPVEKYVPQPSLATPPRPRGNHVDLQPILDEVNQTFFGGRIEARITWASSRSTPNRRRRRRSRTLQFGVWDETRRLIRVHPGLDDPRVPLEFLRYLVYHELCHAAAPPRVASDRRRRIHHSEFRALERRFPGWERMERLGKTLFERITRERESG